jgi:myo-inositol 2-dehydrogenase/D-chiro-inositol 1-dehydrogenase
MKRYDQGRREFLKKAATATVAFTIIPRHVLGGQGYTAPGDQLTKGIIGVGGMGRGHIGYEGTRLIAVCDVDKNHLSQAISQAGGNIAGYHDFRELIARDDIDIVHIATPPHWQLQKPEKISGAKNP